jgi:hypothetical protein
LIWWERRSNSSLESSQNFPAPLSGRSNMKVKIMKKKKKKKKKEKKKKKKKNKTFRM